MLKRYFLSNLIVMVLSNLLVKPIWIFLIDRTVQLRVGHEQYGLYSALLSLSVIFSIVLDFGITNYNNRNIANDNSQIHFTLPNMIAAKGVFSFIYFLLIFCTAYFLSYSGEALYILLLLGAVQFLNSFLQFLRSNVSANHDFKIDSLLSVLDKVVMILVCGFLLLAPSTRNLFIIEWYLYAQLAAYFISILVAIWIIGKRYAKIDFQHFSLQEMKSFCIKSLPYALLILLMGVYMRSDSLLLERLEGAADNSVYAEAYRILDALNMIGFLLAGILLPMFTRLIARKINIHDIIKTSANIMLSISLCIVAHSLVYAKEIMLFLDANAVESLPTIYQFLIACFPAFCVMYIYSTLLTANGDIVLLIKIALAGCIISIGLNLFLIPILHAKGAAITALIVQTTVALCSIYYCVKKFSLPIDYLWALKFILVFCVILFVSIVARYFNVPLFASILIVGVIFLGFVYLIKLWSIQTILDYSKQYKTLE